MQTAHLLLLVLVLTPVAYSLALMRSRAVAEPLGGIRNLKALPFYYAARAALWCAIPALIVLAVWAARRDPQFVDVARRHLRFPANFEV